MREKPTALQKAVEILARREHSQHELRYKLASKDYDDEEIEGALQRLLEKGLQSDERFTESYIASRYQRGQGPYKITAELKQRGVDESLIDSCINAERFDWFELAKEAYLKKYSDKPVADFNEKAKRSRFLQQRGFTGEQVQYALSV